MESLNENIEGGIHIDLAKPEDVLGIQEVFYKSWLETYPNEEYGITVDDVEDRFKDGLNKEKLLKRAEQIANLPESEKMFVAKEGDKIIGVCRAILRPEGNQLQAIYIMPEYQGQGIGKKLWEKAQEFFDKQKDTIVQVATYNTKAIEFYEKLGFEDDGKRFEDERFRMKSGSIIPEMEMVIKASK